MSGNTSYHSHRHSRVRWLTVVFGAGRELYPWRNEQDVQDWLLAPGGADMRRVTEVTEPDGKQAVRERVWDLLRRRGAGSTRTAAFRTSSGRPPPPSG